MDKQNQIEEIARIICDNYNNGGCEIDGDVCNYRCSCYEDCKKLYNAGYRKIPENAVVLTGTETEERLVDLLVDFDEMGLFPATLTPDPDEYAREWKRKLMYAIGQLCNERVKKFAEMLKAMSYQSTDWSHGEHPMVVEVDYIDEILNEITEGKQ